jgi:hypothetical protein
LAESAQDNPGRAPFEPTTDSGHVVALDGLRKIAAIGVLLYLPSLDRAPVSSRKAG